MNTEQRRLTREIDATLRALKKERNHNRLVAAYMEIEKKASEARRLAGNPDTSYPG